jgi:hypothetical protein
MNRTALKYFAATARKELLKKVEAKALKLGITEEKIKNKCIEGSAAIFIDGKQLTVEEKNQRDKLMTHIDQAGFKQVIEEVAYTWFNRVTVLWFMEVNHYLPEEMVLLSSFISNSGVLENSNEISEINKVDTSNEELCKQLIIKQCTILNRYLPFAFENIHDYEGILFPERLLTKDSFIWQMANETVIPEDHWRNVEIIGWLYQYYISEDKDRVIKAKKKYRKEDIPYATQLFTPKWIVKYLVQNSLGRYWVESHPEHLDLVANWEFYLENRNHKEGFPDKLGSFINKDLKVEDIKCFDPAMGSGHILVYLFDVLYEMYFRCGYSEEEIPRLIIEKNLYGLDIDERASRLASFSVVMKAMEYNRDFLKSIEKHGLHLHMASLQETNSLSEKEIVYIAGTDHGEDYENTKDFIHQFLNAKIFGSLINPAPFNLVHLERRLQYINNHPEFDSIHSKTREKVQVLLPQLIQQYYIMNNVYDVLVSNPPYMGNRYMSRELADFVKNHYSKTKMDLFSAFIENSFHKVHKNGHLAFMSPFVWMFIGIYKPLREMIVKGKTISSLVQLEYSAFEDATVPICALTIRNSSLDIEGEYIKLSNFKGAKMQPLKLKAAVQNPNTEYRYSVKTKQFNEIANLPIAYWISNDLRAIFKNKTLYEYSISDGQNVTGNNDQYVRFFWEVKKDKIGINKKWVLYAKGGGFRKWSGNLDNVVDWSEEAREHYRKDYICRIIPTYLWYKKGITWGLITSNLPSFRVLPESTTFDKGGSSIFFEDDSYYYFFLGLLNSKIFLYIANILNPTLNFQVKDVRAIPIILPSDSVKQTIDLLVNENIQLSEEDWNSFEGSWHFSKHPFLSYKKTLLKDAFLCWKDDCVTRFNKLKANEEKINKLIFELYNITEMDPKVEEKDVTVVKGNVQREMISFLSYAVGCMFGRYSLDVDGLINTGEKEDPAKYKTFSPVSDHIIPIQSESYFENDIVEGIIAFVKAAFGEYTLTENLNFIADALGKKNGECAADRIRRYFVNDFFKDHVQTYKKRPIYWLFTSGKQKAFQCLVYMHHYDKTTLSRLRSEYLHKYQTHLVHKKHQIITIMQGNFSTVEVSNTKQEYKVLHQKIKELQEYDELLHIMEDQQIELDFDDGIRINYQKFNGLTAKI